MRMVHAPDTAGTTVIAATTEISLALKELRLKTHDEIEKVYKANVGAGHGAALDAVYRAGVGDAETAAQVVKDAKAPVLAAARVMPATPPSYNSTSTPVFGNVSGGQAMPAAGAPVRK